MFYLYAIAAIVEFVAAFMPPHNRWWLDLYCFAFGVYFSVEAYNLWVDL